MSGFPSEVTRTAPARSSRRRRGTSRLRGALPSETTRSPPAPRSEPVQTKQRVGRRSKPPSDPTWISSERSTPRTRSGLSLLSLSATPAEDSSLGPVRRSAFRLSLLAVVSTLAVPGVALALMQAPPVDARAALVANPRTGEILLARDANREVPIASITKLMTVTVALDHVRPSAKATVSASAAAIGESSVHLRPGERISVRDLLKAALIQSANDAADALASYAAHGSVSRFVAMMNAKAKALGLSHTHFTRPDGLDAPGHYSSARDVYRLARVAMRRPVVRKIVRLRSARIAGGRSLYTWNDLLGTYRGLFGVKTGHTLAAGWNEVAAARRGGVTLYAVVLGSPERSQRNADLAALLNWGFEQYGRVQVVRAGRTYARVRTRWNRGEVALVPASAASAVVRLDRPLLEKVVARAVTDVPVSRGERLGEVLIYERHTVIARVPLVAARAVSAPGWTARLGWYAARTLDEAGAMLAGVAAALQ